MKTSIFLILLFCMVSCATTAQAQQNFIFDIHHVGEDMFKSSSGVGLRLGSECDVKDHTTVVLHYFGNPADSLVGPLYDNITYDTDTPTIIDGEIAPAGTTITCGVFGTSRLQALVISPIETTSRAIWDDTNSKLLVFNIEIWRYLENTGTYFSFGSLKYIGDSTFVLEEFIE